MGRTGYLGEFEQVVLLAVARLGGEAYGMRIREEIESRTGRAVTIGAVYATLDRLEDKAYVRTRDEESSGRAKRFFEMLPAGVEALEAAREVQARMWAGVRLPRTRRP